MIEAESGSAIRIRRKRKPGEEGVGKSDEENRGVGSAKLLVMLEGVESKYWDGAGEGRCPTFLMLLATVAAAGGDGGGGGGGVAAAQPHPQTHRPLSHLFHQADESGSSVAAPRVRRTTRGDDDEA